MALPQLSIKRRLFTTCNKLTVYSTNYPKMWAWTYVSKINNEIHIYAFQKRYIFTPPKLGHKKL